MDELIQFLRAQLDLDERTALAVQDNSAPFTGQWKMDGEALRTYNDWVLAYLPEGRPFRPGVLAHIARHDPARVLRDVAAKRAILDEALKYEAKIDGEWACCHDADQIAAGECSTKPADIPIFRLLAAGYDTEPGYQEAWRP